MFDGALFPFSVNAVLPRVTIVSFVTHVTFVPRVTFVTHKDRANYQNQTITPYINYTHLYNGAACVRNCHATIQLYYVYISNT